MAGEIIMGLSLLEDAEIAIGYGLDAVGARVGGFIRGAGEPDSSYRSRLIIELLNGESAGEWNGEGLPPVGTVCEWCPNQDGWVQIQILGHDVEETWFRRAGESISETCLRMAFFRPIRTPEQIAAEERAKTINAMGALIRAVAIDEYNPAAELEAAEALYDAGYRKFEIVEGE